MAPCPGNCNAWWRALTEEQQAASESRPRPGDPIWCTKDAAIIGVKLVQLDDLAAEREYQGDGFREQGRAPARGGNTPSPSPAMDDLLDLDKMLTEWEAAYRDWWNQEHPERPWLTTPYRGVLCTVRHGTVCWLSQNLGGILTSPLAEDFGLEVGQWHREFVAKTRAGTGRKLAALPCPSCGLRLLARAEGYDGYVCGNCNRHVPGWEYDELVTQQLERAG